MRYERRRDMRPGTIFLYPTGSGWSPYDRLLVVLDQQREVDFWRGDRLAIGDVMPAIDFEVLS